MPNSEGRLEELETEIDNELNLQIERMATSHQPSTNEDDTSNPFRRQNTFDNSDHESEQFWTWCDQLNPEALKSKAHSLFYEFNNSEHTIATKQFCFEHRFIFGLLIPFLVETALYWILAASFGLHTHYNELVNGTPRYFMAIAMIVGSFIAGSTPVGGGVVGFPMITLIYDRPAVVGNHFSLLVQACGMTGASFSILFMNLSVEWLSIFYGCLGGFVGYPAGLAVSNYIFTHGVHTAFLKIFMSCFWTTFVYALYMLNGVSGRRTFHTLPSFSAGEYVVRKGHLTVNWKALILFSFGVGGGICTAFSGTGIDVCMFACLTLVFRVVENVGSRTSVLIMTIQSWYSLLYLLITEEINQEAIDFISVCAPVSVFMAPLGAVFASGARSTWISGQLYVVQAITFVSTLAIVKPWDHGIFGDQADSLCIFFVLVLFFGGWFFNKLIQLGLHLMERAVSQEMKSAETNEAEIDSNRHEWSNYNTNIFKHSLLELQNMKNFVKCRTVKQHAVLYANTVGLDEAIDFAMKYTEVQQYVADACVDLGNKFLVLEEKRKLGLNDKKHHETKMNVVSRNYSIRMFSEPVKHLVHELEKTQFLERFIRSKFGRDYIWRQTITLEGYDDPNSEKSSSQTPSRSRVYLAEL